ncbi:MAG: PilW family protein [Actinomycetota bacterium]
MSVIELTIALGVFLIVVTAMYTLFAVVQRTTVRQDKRNEVNNDIRLSMERMSKEIRQATNIYSDSGVSLLHMDTFDNGSAITVTWRASGTTLTRTMGTTTSTLLTGLTSTSIFAYSPSITGATDVTLTLKARPAHYSTDPAVIVLTSQVRLRNRSPS